MATTITAASTAPILRQAADWLASLPHLRVVRTDVHHALLLAAPQYDIAQAALDTLAEHVQDAAWLSHWATPHARDEVVAEMRAAADNAEQAETADRLASADQSFDWTRQYRPDIRALLTTALEIGDRAFRWVRPIVSMTGGES